ncbi:MAG TPA: Fe(2+)-trafficking protein [Thermoanaerobaculia bacterium]|nr:Fe(2+)-trafficking protein [Thermoanaerobaculia bacterium]
MPEDFRCSRCAKDGPRLTRVPLPGAIAAEIKARVCADCWAEWLKMEVMVINELRLNFMDPSAPAILEQQLRQFLFLEPSSA